jgi:hypothetical protein
VEDFWTRGENFRTGWQNKRNKALWSKKLRCDVAVWEKVRENFQYAFKKNRASAFLDATVAIRMWHIYHAPGEVGANAPSILRAQGGA